MTLMIRSKSQRSSLRKIVRHVRKPQLLQLLKLEDRSVPATINGTVFNDINGDGTIISGEPGIGGATVYLDNNANGILDTGMASFGSTDVPKAIPTSSPTPTTSVITVAGAGTIADINVTVDITHSYDGDMEITLVSPGGTRIGLALDNGSGGDNYSITTFDDEAATSIVSGTAPFNGSYQPEQPLSILDGSSQTGTWTLEVLDDVSGDGGNINAWSLTISTGATEPSMITPDSGNYSFTGLPANTYTVRQVPFSGFAVTTPATGKYTPTLTAADTFTGNFGNRRPPAAAYGTVFNDLDTDGVIDPGENGQANITLYDDINNNGVLDSATTTKNSTNVPVAISATGTPTVTSTLTTSGLGSIVDIDVSLSISHTYDEDLDIFLISPSGAKLELSTDNGGSSDDYQGTIFDDEAAVSITAGTAPFTGSFRPEGTLASLDGSSANGTWTLQVTDDVSSDGGSLTAWGLTITFASEALAVSNAKGDYYFSGLPAGTHRIRQLAPPAGQSQTFPLSNGAQVVTLAANDGVAGLHFGNRLAPASFTGIAFDDANKNKTQDGGEGPLSNITVFLDTDQDGVLDGGEKSTTTDGSGVYTFSNVTPGLNYFLAAVVPGGATLTAPIRNGLQVLPPVNASKSNGDDNETTVAIDPGNPSRLMTGYNSSAGVSISFSTDAGNTWNARGLPGGGDNVGAQCCDANTTWDKFGNLWMVTLTDNITTLLSRSTDGGATFQIVQDFGSSDHPSIAVGPSATAGQQTLAFQDNNGGGCRVAIMQINAAGVIGSPTVSLAPDSNTGISGNFGDIAIGPFGQVAVTYVNASSGQGPDNCYFNIDPDGSGPQPFGPRSVITATNIGGFDFLPPQPQRSVDSEPDLAWATNGANSGRLYLLYTDEVVDEGSDSEIFIRYSDNSGSTWSPRIRINDDATTNSQFLGRLAMEQTTGNLAASFYDARDSITNTKVHYYASASFDGGMTWAPNAKLSTGQSDETSGSGFDFGDYNDIDYVQGRFVTSWGDNSNSTGDNPNGTSGQDVYIGRVDVANNVKNHYVAGAVAGKSYTGLDFGFYGVISAPAVSNIVVNDGNAQRSRLTKVVVNFSSAVSLSSFTGVGQVYFERTGIPTNSLGTIGTMVDTSNGLLITQDTGTSITLRFQSPLVSAGVEHGSLADGRWQLNVLPASYASPNGPGDTQLRRLFGNFDNDTTVDGSDFGFFPPFGSQADNPFDWDDSGDIGGVDFGEFGNRFGITLL